MVLSFVVISVILTLIPGPDLLYVVRNGMHGRRHAVAAGLGAATAALVWGGTAALGVAELLDRSAEVFTVVKLIGAAYLILLGVRTLWETRRAVPIAASDEATQPSSPPRSAYMKGMGIDLLNPKTGLFYVALLPQVIPHGIPVLQGTLTFAGVDAVVAAITFAIVAFVTATVLRWLRRPAVVRNLERSTGVCMVALGLRTAVESF